MVFNEIDDVEVRERAVGARAVARYAPELLHGDLVVGVEQRGVEADAEVVLHDVAAVLAARHEQLAGAVGSQELLAEDVVEGPAHAIGHGALGKPFQHEHVGAVGIARELARVGQQAAQIDVEG